MKKSDELIGKEIKINGAIFSALCAGIKYKDRNDLMLIYVDQGSSLAGVFTKSSTRSASVIWSETIIKSSLSIGNGPYAILVNSGNANAYTGQEGHHSVRQVMQALSNELGVDLRSVLMASTGVIGEYLPYEKIIDAMPELVKGLSATKMKACSRAMMTTDTYPKICSKEIILEGEIITIAGIAKGSGMIAPNMGTMLSFILTDAKIEQKMLQNLTSRACENTFNSITVDSDTSTSDMVLVAATSKVNMTTIRIESDPRSEKIFSALESVMKDLAIGIVRDGEGASKFVEYHITGAVSNISAKKIALSIANSPLVKTAIAGEDPNWGRVIMALGKSGEKIEQEKIVIHFGENIVTQHGRVAEDYSEKQTQLYMKRTDLIIRIDLGLGDGESIVWGCDFTKKYVEINADYRS